MTTPGAGHETVDCPKCDDRIGGDEPFCPFCGKDLWGVDERAFELLDERSRDTPYRVYGYNDLCEDFEYNLERFTDAVKKYRELDKQGMNIVFIDGVSEPVRQRLFEMWGGKRAGTP